MSHNTDFQDVEPCNRNNCRCGDDTNCMYYNSPGIGHSHYNYTAIQGAGAPTDPNYRCASKAFDTFNAQHMYGDYAIGDMGSASETAGASQLAGTVHFGDESAYGQRDMCNHAAGFHPFANVRRGVRDHRTFITITLVAVLLYGFWNGQLSFSDRRTQLLLAAALVFILFFFR